jgi:hypothetical protein
MAKSPDRSSQPRRTNRGPRIPTENQALLSLQQIDLVYGWPATTTNEYIKRGELPFVKIGDGRRNWIRRADVEMLITRSAVRHDKTTGQLVATR